MWLEVFLSFLSLALELTILFIVISFMISLLQGVIPYNKIVTYLSGRNKLIGATAALVLAFITPFCSCSTIPFVVNLLNKKIPFGIVMVFLFSSPLLDPTIITLMGAILGVKVAVTYTLITSIFSVIIGLLLERLGFESAVKRVIMTRYVENQPIFGLKLVVKEMLELMKRVYPYLIVGAAIGSVIKELVPTNWVSYYLSGSQWWLVPIAAMIGIPLYVRVSTMIPLSQVLIAKGMAIAPVMALMISSAGASLPEITLLYSIFEKRLVHTFIFSVFSMATLSGLLFYII